VRVPYLKETRNARNHSIELFGVQATQLLEHTEQKKADREAGNQEILPVLPETHASQGSEIGDIEKG
jgi:hypothetical protein